MTLSSYHTSTFNKILFHSFVKCKDCANLTAYVRMKKECYGVVMRLALTFLTVIFLTYGVALAQEASEDQGGMSHVGPVTFDFPVACDLNVDCFAVNYVDQQGGDGHADFECGRKTYDGHKGTDFAVVNRRDMQRGVNVLAARAGKVLRVRNGESDAIKTEDEFEAIKKSGKECGNGVLVEHEDGWQSLYCHLKNNSIVVKPDQHVNAGDVLAQVGESGYSEFPHLHFALLKKGQYIDPYTGLVKETGCNLHQQSLWSDPIEYAPFTVFDSGFDIDVPDFTKLRRGEYQKPDFIPLDAPSMVFWFATYHSVEGDVVRIYITGPNGYKFHQYDFTMQQNKKRPNYYYAGRKTQLYKLHAGEYKAQVTIARRDDQGNIIAQDTFQDVIHVK